MSTTKQIRVTINGQVHEANVEPRMLLTDFLRHEIFLGGVHVGCEHGVCGVCTILMDGKAVGSIDTLEKGKAVVNYGMFTTNVSVDQLELVEARK